MMAGSASTAQGLIPALLSLHNPKHSPVLITSYDSSCYRLAHQQLQYLCEGLLLLSPGLL